MARRVLLAVVLFAFAAPAEAATPSECRQQCAEAATTCATCGRSVRSVASDACKKARTAGECEGETNARKCKAAVAREYGRCRGRAGGAFRKVKKDCGKRKRRCKSCCRKTPDGACRDLFRGSSGFAETSGASTCDTTGAGGAGTSSTTTPSTTSTTLPPGSACCNLVGGCARDIALSSCQSLGGSFVPAPPGGSVVCASLGNTLTCCCKLPGQSACSPC